MARTWPPQPPTPMIDSLRDQLLNLGFKAPEPERKPGHRPAAGKGGAGVGGTAGPPAGTPHPAAGKPGGPRHDRRVRHGAKADSGNKPLPFTP